MGCQAVTGDPLPKYLKSVERLVRYKSWPEIMKPLVKCNKLGTIPPMFGVIKDHKVNFPMRPIVNKQKSPSYFLEKALVPFLRDILPTSTRALKSTKDFVQKLEQIQLPDSYILATMDIVALYPSIDVDESLAIIKGIIESSGGLNQAEKDTVLSTLNLVANNNFFIFDSVVFVQQQGAPMGSPVSGLLAEFVLRQFEETCISNAIIQPLAWFRFVDDILIIWPDSIDTLTSFYNEINNAHPHLRFTIEYETNSSIPYLDVLLTRTNMGISRKIFRKSICNRVTIPAKAIAPKRYKLAAFRAYICRALDICTPENIHEEFNIIREIGCQNGYSVSDINTLIAKITRHVPVNEDRATKNNRVPITYLPVFHERLSRFLQNFDVHLVAKTFPKLKDYVKVNLDPVPEDARAGVYEVPYEDSDGTHKSYIGMTTRKLETRLKEHKYDVRVGKESTALARVCYNDPAVKVKFDEARVIASLETRRRTLIRESLEIFLRGQKVCNEQSSMDVPNLWKGLFNI